MRTSNSLKNSITSIFSNIIAMLISFIAQAFFIRILGAEYLGLNGLFSNILTMLGIFELGIGNAIVYNLYKPIADNNVEKIKSLMGFYKKAYNIIAFLILCFGLCIIPFLEKIVGTVTVDINLYVIYIMFLLSTISSYIISYKRSLIYAMQKNYIINIIHMCYLIVLNISQLVILFLTKNYYVYLIIKILCQLLENFAISCCANRLYPYIKEKNVSKLDKQTEKNIFSKVKALIYHKIGAVIVFGTDNIIISYFFGIITVGLYSNYTIIINAVNTVVSQATSSITASVGNLMVTSDEHKIFNTFKKIRFLNFWISCFTGVCILVIIQPFIEIWVGSEYLLKLSIIIVLVLDYFQKMQRQVYNVFKDSAGIWQEDKYVPIIESILNIIFSILLLKLIGLPGVFLGTIVSGLALWCYSYPKFVYKKLFGRSYFEYAKETLGYILLFILVAFSTYFISTLIVINSLFVKLLVNAVLCLLLPNLVLIIIFRKNDNFLYFSELLKKIMCK